MTTPLVIILNLVLVIAVVVGIVGMLGWSIATQTRDHLARAAGRVRRQPRTSEAPAFVGLGTGQRRTAI